MQHVTGAANPVKVLSDMEANIPLWWAAMRESTARMKPMRFVILDLDYLRKPREPIPAKANKQVTAAQKRNENFDRA